ncbi:DUF3596 domain-containing protein [Guyparkeria sp. GHLCS8-2]|uniref:Arm DNA-binding domain-containing protein n=1 Tax=Guyparkeria halopsychrophila TaxID=3139421 RepID=UPI0037C5095D
MAKGVEVRGGKIRVYFSYQGKLCREPIGLAATDENLAYAEQLAQMVRHEIKIGTFDYAQRFPESRNLAENTLGHYLALWLDLKRTRVAKSTLTGYRTCADRILVKFGDRQADQVDYLEIEAWVSEELDYLSSKSIKETIAVLRQVYSLYQTRNRKAWDPTKGVHVRLPDDDDPDPFTRREIERILSYQTERVQNLNLTEFMIWSGPRWSEACLLAWEDVDLSTGTVQFRRAAVRGNIKATKTRRSTRKVELLKPAWEALKRQYKMTGGQKPIEVMVVGRDNRTVRREVIRPVFRPKPDGMPYTTDNNFRKKFFKPMLEATGVRFRGPGNCRHTFISQCLTAGLPVTWIADQVGHSSPTMIYRNYGKWINDDAGDMRKLAEKALGLE